MSDVGRCMRRVSRTIEPAGGCCAPPGMPRALLDRRQPLAGRGGPAQPLGEYWELGPGPLAGRASGRSAPRPADLARLSCRPGAAAKRPRQPQSTQLPCRFQEYGAAPAVPWTASWSVLHSSSTGVNRRGLEAAALS